ncbi:hypothetical protein PI125_g21289 [Phytophthora idaei]|nr:hypothetical protein PI125_g21289 [Phytophthora idaei]KAG3135401.1 hypothetical protein PI126_g18274 [Phytophthora idaei]
MSGTSMSDASKASYTSLEHAEIPPLSSIEWEALHRLAAASAAAVIQALLTAGTEAQQCMAAQEFTARELADLLQGVSTPTPTKNKIDIAKLDVSTFSGEGDDRRRWNRWFRTLRLKLDSCLPSLHTLIFSYSRLRGRRRNRRSANPLTTPPASRQWR